MNREWKKGLVIAFLLGAGVVGLIIGSEAKSAVNTTNTLIQIVEGGRPYRHQSHLTISISIPDSSSYIFPANIGTGSGTGSVSAAFNSDDGTVTNLTWDVYSKTVVKRGKRMVIELIAKQPQKNSGAFDQTGGTGSIVITTIDPTTGGGTTTTSSINVEPVETLPSP